MALQACQTGTTTGFPIVLSQNLYNDWPATRDSQGQLKSIVAPTDFTIAWSPAADAMISVRHTSDVFHIEGFDTVATGTTLTYGLAQYNCSHVLSVTQNQHASLSKSSDSLQYEAILAFYIKNKAQNPRMQRYVDNTQAQISSPPYHRLSILRHLIVGDP